MAFVAYFAKEPRVSTAPDSRLPGTNEKKA
jgi:hypothetical protein